MNKLTANPTAMQKVITVATFMIIISSCSTTNPAHSRKTNTGMQNDSVLVDKEGNRYTVKLLSDGHWWMTSNLNLNIPGSYCYENLNEHCRKYGRLYTWAAAQEACSLLGETWRLPTNAELGHLIKLYGGSEDSNLVRKGAYQALLISGTSGFNALLGGGRAPDGQYARGDAHGFYWTSTEGITGKAWFYNFAKGSQALYQQSEGEKARAFSVRCLKAR